MRAILVSVDYSDILALTLPYNRHHFEAVYVVTSLADQNNVLPICKANDATVLATDAFYDDGAAFNKWKALEWGLDLIGRSGWICLMDADICWPKSLPQETYLVGTLYTPYRRMCVTLPPVHSQEVPVESSWQSYPLHRQQTEFAGYTQIFHANDPHLPQAPWHEVDWRHAGGADSMFQARWEPHFKVRPKFEVLHLGPAGENWMGRVTPYMDGSIHPEAEDRQRKLTQIFSDRRTKQGKPDKFSHEKL